MRSPLGRRTRRPMHKIPQRTYRCQRLAGLLLAIAACARHPEGARPSSTAGYGRFVWTDSSSHEANRPAFHTRCGSVLHVWVQDTFSPHRTTGMVVAVLGFEGRTRVPAYAEFDGRRSGPEAHAELQVPGNTQFTSVIGQLRFDEVTDDDVAGQLSGRLVWSSRWDQADTSGTLLLDFRAPRRREMEQYLCHGLRM
jgi:hypothetical protein